MRISIRKCCRFSCIELNVKPMKYEHRSYHHSSDKHIQYWAELSPWQMKKLETRCGPQPAYWVLYVGDKSFFGKDGEVKVQLAVYACQNNGRQKWALVWGRKNV